MAPWQPLRPAVLRNTASAFKDQVCFCLGVSGPKRQNSLPDDSPAESTRFVLWAIAALTVPNIGYSETATIEIDSTNLHSIEISYSINTGEQQLCYLGLPTENGTAIPSPPIRHRIIKDIRISEVSPLAEYAQYMFP